MVIIPVAEFIMHTVKASEFKAKCLALMDQVASTGEAILVTKNGKPVAELHPHSGTRISAPFGIHKGLVEVTGDIVSPLAVEWESMK
jgi:prevent-host-death family protein